MDRQRYAVSRRLKDHYGHKRGKDRARHCHNWGKCVRKLYCGRPGFQHRRQDLDGNTTTEVSGDTTLSVDAGTISPTFIAEADFTDDGIWTGNVTLSQAGLRTITATNNGKTGQDTITIDVGALDSFIVDAPDTGAIDLPFSVTVTAKDSEGNTTTEVSGDTELSVDAGIIFPTSVDEADFTDDGTWTGDVTLWQAGARTITAINNGKSGQDTITIGYTLTMVVTGWGSVTPAAGDTACAPGAEVNISAACAGACWEFLAWTGDVTDPDSASTTVVMDGDKTVTANFAWIEACQFHHSEECTVCHASEKSGATSNLDVIAEVVDTSRLIDGTDSGNAEVIFTSYTGDNSFADGDEVMDGVCEVCHTNTRYHKNDGSGVSHHAGEDCAPCHLHCDEFAHGGGEPDCFTAGCHAVNLMHAAHFVNDPPGLPPDETGCNVCHADGRLQCQVEPVLKDFQPFPGTSVCDPCHAMPPSP
jgi:hypothetical protein